jgi:hypothetical protein
MNSLEFMVIITIVFILGLFAGFLLKDTIRWFKQVYDRFLFRPNVLKPLTAKNRSNFEPEDIDDDSN